MAKAAANPPFLGAGKSKTPSGFDAAIFGAPHGTPYKGIDNRVHAGSPRAFRKALAADAAWLEHWDFDLGGTLLEGGLRLADLGDLADQAAGRRRKSQADRSLHKAHTRGWRHSPDVRRRRFDPHSIHRRLRRRPARSPSCRSTPISTGATSATASATASPAPCGVPPRVPCLAHRAGRVRAVSAAPVPRKSKMRASGGSTSSPPRDIHRDGIATVLAHIPEDTDCLISLDCDALDFSQMPAVAYPSPGGLTYTQVTGLIAGVAAKARIVGFDHDRIRGRQGPRRRRSLYRGAHRLQRHRQARMRR